MSDCPHVLCYFDVLLCRYQYPKHMNLRHFRIFDYDTKQQLRRIQHAGYLKCTDGRAYTLGLRDRVCGTNFGTSNKPNLVHSARVPMLLAACMRFRVLSRAVLRYQAAIKGQHHDERDFYSVRLCDARYCSPSLVSAFVPLFHTASWPVGNCPFGNNS